MSYNTVNHSILDPIALTSLTPMCDPRHSTLSFKVNTAKTQGLLLGGEEVISVETFTFKSMGMVVVFTPAAVMCHLYWIDFKKNEIISKSSTYEVTETYPSPVSIYGWLAGLILTEADKSLWFFNQGSGTRSKFGWILNHLITNGEDKPFSGKFGNKTLSLVNRVVNITNVAGEIVYQSRVTRLQKTLLKD